MRTRPRRTRRSRAARTYEDMCHFIGALLMVISMALCYLFSLVSDDACPFLYTRESGRSPATWFIVLGALLNMWFCCVWCLSPSKRRRRRHREACINKDDPACRMGLVAPTSHD